MMRQAPHPIGHHLQTDPRAMFSVAPTPMSSNMQPGELYMLRRRLQSSNNQLKKGSSCQPCRLAKRKCDGVIPCKTCISRNMSSECCAVPAQPGSAKRKPVSPVEAEETQEAVKASRPSNFDYPLRTNSIARFSQSISKERELMLLQIPHELLRHMCRSGISEKVLSKAFRCMTPALRTSVDEAVGAVQTIVFTAMMGKNKESDPQKKAEDSLLYQQVSLEKEQKALDAWDNSDRIGTWVMWYDPETSQRTAVWANNWYAEHIGVHKEELLARIARNDFPYASSEFKVMCYVLDYLSKMSSQSTFTYYTRQSDRPITAKEEKGVLLRERIHFTKDSRGRVLKVMGTCSRITPAEYDHVRLTQPELVDPYFPALATGETAEQLCARRDVNQVEDLENMSNSVEGRRRLDLLAEEMARRYQVQIALARQIRAASLCQTSMPAQACSPTGLVSAAPSPTDAVNIKGEWVERAASESSTVSAGSLVNNMLHEW